MPAQAQNRSTLTPSPAGLVVPGVAPLDPAKNHPNPRLAVARGAA